MGNFNRGNFGRRGFNRSKGRDSGRFGRGDSGRFGRRDSNRLRGSGDRAMHEAICGKCGSECEVPFKPTEGKPVYCSDCFKEKSREVGSRSELGKQSNESLKEISRKLDKILKILEAAKETVENHPESKKPKKIIKIRRERLTLL